MMNTENFKSKQIYFKAYDHLSMLQNALTLIKEQESTGLQTSILGKVAQFNLHIKIEIPRNTDTIRSYWEKRLHYNTTFGNLYNPDIGDIFIVGALTSTFLNRVDGKALGMLSVGPYGILRGIGASETQANHYLKLLKSGHYLLILRGFDDELEIVQKILQEKKIV